MKKIEVWMFGKLVAIYHIRIVAEDKLQWVRVRVCLQMM